MSEIWLDGEIVSFSHALRLSVRCLAFPLAKASPCLATAHSVSKASSRTSIHYQCLALNFSFCRPDFEFVELNLLKTLFRHFIFLQLLTTPTPHTASRRILRPYSIVANFTLNTTDLWYSLCVKMTCDKTSMPGGRIRAFVYKLNNVYLRVNFETSEWTINIMPVERFAHAHYRYNVYTNNLWINYKWRFNMLNSINLASMTNCRDMICEHMTIQHKTNS